MSNVPLIAGRGPVNRWIESPLYDSLLFMAAPLLGGLYLVALLRAPHLRIIPGIFFTVGMAHYLSTFSFYLGDDNRAHYRSHVTIFFFGPLALLAAAGLMRAGSLLPLLLTIIYLWNVWHISLQSCGILSVYRHLAGGPQDEKRFANGLIISVSAAFVGMDLKYFAPLHQLLIKASPALEGWIFDVALIALVVAAGAYIYRIFYRARIGMPLAGPEAIFLLSSVVLFHPFAWTRDTLAATNGVLFGHFVQYLSLVWLLHRRKYSPNTGSRLQNSLAYLSRNVTVLAMLLLTTAIAFYAFSKVTQRFGVSTLWAWLFNALVLTHFYLDGWIWAFKRPFVRQSLGPYLSRRILPQTSAAAPLAGLRPSMEAADR